MKKQYDYKLAKKLYKKGMTDAAIAEGVGCSPKTITRWRNDNNLPGNPKFAKNTTIEVKIRKMYERGFTPFQIASMLVVQRDQVIARLDTMGIGPNPIKVINDNTKEERKMPNSSKVSEAPKQAKTVTKKLQEAKAPVAKTMTVGQLIEALTKVCDIDDNIIPEIIVNEKRCQICSVSINDNYTPVGREIGVSAICSN